MKYNVVFGTRIVMWNLDKEHVERLAAGMGEGYSTAPVE